MRTRSLLPIAIFLLAAPVDAQLNSPTNYAAPNPNPPAITGETAPAGGYALSPMIYTQPQTFIPRVAGNVRKYTPVEYGKVVLSTLKASNFPTTNPNPALESIVQSTTDPVSGLPQYEPAAIEVVQVLDRGVLLSHSREEIRLRGLRVPSGRDSNEVMALYGREANQLLTQLTGGKPIQLALGVPLRDKNGFILAMAYLPDGTELNQLLLTMGYAKMAEEDFAVGSKTDIYKAAEGNARGQNLGIWSRNSSPMF